MKLPRLRTVLLTPIVLFAAFYVFGVVLLMTRDNTLDAYDKPSAPHRTIAIFGATGTAGDGILKAALADPGIEEIIVVTAQIYVVNPAQCSKIWNIGLNLAFK